MLTDSRGHVNVTIVDGTTFTGIQALDGSLNVYDASTDTTPVGLYHPCGAMNIYLVSGTDLTGRAAPNGAMYVVNDSSEYGIYHPCGAMNITGLVVSGAASFLSKYGPYGMVMDFTDASIAIDDVTDVLNYNSIGQVSSGALIGPGAKLTNTAPSLKLTEQADGYLAFQAHNLCLQSDSPANWTASNTVLSDVNLFTENTATTPHYALLPQNTSIALVGATYLVSIDVKAEGGLQWVRISGDGFSGSLGTASSFDVLNGVVGTKAANVLNTSISTLSADGYYTCTLEVVAANTTVGPIVYLATSDGLGSVSYAGNGTRGMRLRKVHVRRTPSASDYIKTTTAAVYDLPYVYSGSSRIGIMVEPAATNVNLYSRDLTNAAWTKRGSVSVTKNQTGIDGVADSACRVSGLGTAGVADIFEAGYSSVRWSASQAVLQSFYIRKVSSSGVLRVTNASTGTLYFSVDFSLLGSNWERITPTHPAVTVGTLTATAGGIFGPQFVATSGTLDFDIDIAQLEAGTVATSPIITYGATVLRAADTPNALLNLFPSIGTAYTIYAKYKPQSASVATTAIRLDDTTANELVSLGNNASGQGLATVTDGGAAQAAITSGTITATAFHRVAASVEANNVRFVVNGGSEVQDTSVTLPTLTRLLIGSGGGMELVQLAILPGARTEAQLQALGA